MKITHQGNFEFCRWADHASGHNISDTTPQEFFQTHMANVRASMLAGQRLQECHTCHQMEKHGKVSGRQRQLLKVGIAEDQFEKSLRSSPYWPAFVHSQYHKGHTDILPRDWQIDLGNHCNSACIYCAPESSSRLAQEFRRLKIINQEPSALWSENSAQVDQLIHSLTTSPQLAYLHFLGGETLITPAFRTVLQRLLDAGLTQVHIGFTTNLTVWDHDVVELLKQFATVHIGLSVECFHPVNDYVRWPSQIDKVKQMAEQWIGLARHKAWYVQLRTTPTALTIPYLTTVYDFALAHGVPIESSNFLQDPASLRMSVLPQHHRDQAADQLQAWIDQHSTGVKSQLVNVRNPAQYITQLTQDAASYVHYLRTSPDETERLPDLVAYLKLLESSRHNCILDYLPEYESILRSAGY